MIDRLGRIIPLQSSRRQSGDQSDLNYDVQIAYRDKTRNPMYPPFTRPRSAAAPLPKACCWKQHCVSESISRQCQNEVNEPTAFDCRFCVEQGILLKHIGFESDLGCAVIRTRSNSVKEFCCDLCHTRRQNGMIE